MHNNIHLETQNVLLRKHYLHVIYLLFSLETVLMAVPLRFFFQLPFCIIALSNFLVSRGLCDDQMIYASFVVNSLKCVHFSM